MLKEKYKTYEFGLPEGWRIFKNDFHQIDPLDDISDDDKFSFIFCLQDMLLIENNEYHLDLGWYGDEDGHYTIHFFKGSWLIGELMEKYSSKKSSAIKQRIDEILTAFTNGDFRNIKGYVVDENDLNNQSDFGDVNNYKPRKN